MTAVAPNRPPTPTSRRAAENDLRHYTPEEVVDPEGKFRLPTTARMLRELAYKRKIPHCKLGGRITFTAPNIRATSEYFTVQPVAKTKRKTAA